jgi:DNA-binding GntR family transcriptional regulator
VLPTSPHEALYRQMMRERARGELPQEVSEAELMPRYNLPRGAVRKLLLRFAAEGLAQRLPGHGWRFAESLDGEDAFRESYEFRMVVNAPGSGRPASTPIRRSSRRSAGRMSGCSPTAAAAPAPTSGSASTPPSTRRWQPARATASLADAVRQQNNLRRMQESAGYEELPPGRIEQSCREHVAILDAVEAGDMEWAEALLRQHLRQAADFSLRAA